MNEINYMGKLYLSICIPTNGRIEIVKNTLDSIYNNCKVPFSEFEVVLSDNSNNDELKSLLIEYNEFPNIVYEKTTCEGFLNSVNALKMGKGLFLKLHNNYTMFTDKGMIELISIIKQSEVNKPLIFFKNFGKNGIMNFNSFDNFCADLSFWNSWSTGFSIWKEDFDKISEVEVNKMFPHTSLLMLQYSKSLFTINDEVYFINQDVPKKGGYNLFRVFAVDYLKILDVAKGNNIISSKTFEKIKRDLFFDFLISWYRNTKLSKNNYTFNLDGIKESMSVYYESTGYYKLKVLSHIYFCISKLKNLALKATGKAVQIKKIKNE